MRRVRLHLVLAAILCLCAARANAQGTNGDLPDPIAAARLTAYADMLGLSPQQRHALDDLHAAYREEFQKLREGEIEAWLKSIRSGPYTRGYVRTKRELLDRIAGIDNRFLDSTLPLLTDEQAGRLQRVRALRQRERLLQVRGFWWWQEPAPFDLSQAVDDLALPDEQRLAIDATLAAYESALTAKLQRLVDQHFDRFRQIFDAYDRAGFTDAFLADPANFEATTAVSQPIIDAEAIWRHEALREVVSLNRDSLASLSAVLPESAARALRAALISTTYSSDAMYREVGMLAHVSSPYDKALERDDLTEDQRAILQSQATAFQKEIDDAVDAMVARVESHQDAYRVNHDRQQEFKDRTAIERAGSDAWQRLMTRRREESERIAGVIGAPAVAASPELPDPETADFSKVGFFSLYFGRAELSSAMPPALTPGDIEQYACWLRLEDADRAKLDGMFQRYRDEFAAFVAEHRQALGETSSALYAGDTVEGWTDENLRRHRAARAAAETRQRAIEDAFFAELLQSLSIKAGDTGLQRVQLARQRQWLNAGIYGSQTTQPGGRRDALFDLSALLRRMRNIDLGATDVDQIMWDYEQAIVPLFKARQAAVAAYTALDEDLRVEWRNKRVETGDQNPDMRARYEERGVTKLRAAAIAAGEPIAELNRATVERLIAVLAADSAERVRHTFDRMAWPRIHEDRSSATALLTAALRLDDLTTQQRTDIENVAAGYRPAYDTICDQMKPVVEGRDSPLYADGERTQEQWLEYQQRHRVRQRMLFDRHELNVRAWQRLKAVLTEDQAKAIGMGATPPEGPGENDDFGT